MSALIAASRHELRRVCRNRALLTLAFSFVLVVAYATWNSSLWVHERRLALTSIAAQENESRDAFLQRMLLARERGRAFELGTSRLAASVWYHPVLPVRAMAVLSVGQADGYPYDARFHAATPEHMIFDALGANIENPAVLAAGHFDLAFVIVFLLPLFLLAATYDLWAQEKELGTLGFVLSQPVRPGTLLLAKILAHGVLPLVAAMLVLAIALLAATRGTGARVDAILDALTVVALYGTFWIAIAAGVNAFAQRSAEAATACGAVYLAVVILIPALLGASVHLLHPAPSRALYLNELRKIEALEGKREVAAFTPKFVEYRARLESRRRLAHTLRFCSPAVLAQHALDRIAGTDADRALAFQSQALAFLVTVRELAAQKRTAPVDLTAPDWQDRLPRFTFVETSIH